MTDDEKARDEALTERLQPALTAFWKLSDGDRTALLAKLLNCSLDEMIEAINDVRRRTRLGVYCTAKRDGRTIAGRIILQGDRPAFLQMEGAFGFCVDLDKLTDIREAPDPLKARV